MFKGNSLPNQGKRAPIEVYHSFRPRQVEKANPAPLYPACWTFWVRPGARAQQKTSTGRHSLKPKKVKGRDRSQQILARRPYVLPFGGVFFRGDPSKKITSPAGSLPHYSTPCALDLGQAADATFTALPLITTVFSFGLPSISRIMILDAPLERWAGL